MEACHDLPVKLSTDSSAMSIRRRGCMLHCPSGWANENCMTEAKDIAGPYVNLKIIVLFTAPQQQQYKSSVPFSLPRQRVHAVTQDNSQPSAGLSSRLASGEEMNKFDRQPRSNRAGLFVRSLKMNPHNRKVSRASSRLHITCPSHSYIESLTVVSSVRLQWQHNGYTMGSKRCLPIWLCCCLSNYASVFAVKVHSSAAG